MERKRYSYARYAWQAFVIFAAIHGALLAPWRNPPVDWPAFAIAVVEWGILGVLLVSAAVWITNKFIAPRTQG
jgi:hypothetical protein